MAGWPRSFRGSRLACPNRQTQLYGLVQPLSVDLELLRSGGSAHIHCYERGGCQETHQGLCRKHVRVGPVADLVSFGGLVWLGCGLCDSLAIRPTFDILPHVTWICGSHAHNRGHWRCWGQRGLATQVGKAASCTRSGFGAGPTCGCGEREFCELGRSIVPLPLVVAHLDQTAIQCGLGL